MIWSSSSFLTFHQTKHQKMCRFRFSLKRNRNTKVDMCIEGRLACLLLNLKKKKISWRRPVYIYLLFGMAQDLLRRINGVSRCFSLYCRKRCRKRRWLWWRSNAARRTDDFWCRVHYANQSVVIMIIFKFCMANI